MSDNGLISMLAHGLRTPASSAPPSRLSATATSTVVRASASVATTAPPIEQAAWDEAAANGASSDGSSQLAAAAAATPDNNDNQASPVVPTVAATTSGDASPSVASLPTTLIGTTTRQNPLDDSAYRANAASALSSKLRLRRAIHRGSSLLHFALRLGEALIRVEPETRRMLVLSNRG